MSQQLTQAWLEIRDKYNQCYFLSAGEDRKKAFDEVINLIQNVDPNPLLIEEDISEESQSFLIENWLESYNPFSEDNVTFCEFD